MLSPEAARFLAASIAIIVLYGVGQSMGNFFSNWINAVARNPEAKDKVNLSGMLGFAFIESIGLLAFAVAMAILFK